MFNINYHRAFEETRHSYEPADSYEKAEKHGFVEEGKRCG